METNECKNMPILIILSQEVEDGVGFPNQSPVKAPVPGAGKLFLEHWIRNEY